MDQTTGTGRDGGRVDRRTVLLATAGLTGLAGCAGGGDTTGNPTSSNSGSGGRTGEGGADGGSIRECPALGGGYLKHDTKATPLPVDFDYPAQMKGNIQYVDPGNWKEGNALYGRIHRGETKNGEDVREGDGDVTLGLEVKYRGIDGGSRDGWYERHSGLEEFTTVKFREDHRPVEFLLSTGISNSDEGNNGWAALGLLPFPSNDHSKTYLFKAKLRVGVTLLMTDYEDVTAGCGTKQKNALKRVVESLRPNTKTTFDTYTDMALDTTAK